MKQEWEGVGNLPPSTTALRIFGDHIISLAELMIKLDLTNVSHLIPMGQARFDKINPDADYRMEDLLYFRGFYQLILDSCYPPNPLSPVAPVCHLPRTKQAAEYLLSRNEWHEHASNWYKYKREVSWLDTSYPEPVKGHTLIAEWNQIEEAFKKDLAEILVFELDKEESEFHSGGYKFSPLTLSNFPDIEADVEESALCFSLERYTACVFHLMRAMEIGVQFLAFEKFEIGLQTSGGKDKEWNNLVEELEKAKGKMPSHTTTEKEKQALFGHAIQHFANVKADRARALHSRSLKTSRYARHEAASIYEEVRRFYLRMNDLKNQSVK